MGVRDLFVILWSLFIFVSCLNVFKSRENCRIARKLDSFFPPQFLQWKPSVSNDIGCLECVEQCEIKVLIFSGVFELLFNLFEFYLSPPRSE